MQNFYPRSPCGERQAGQKGRKPGKRFLSTLSLRRATGGYGCAYLYLIISIHALLAESDGMTEFIGALFDISIHALLAESDSLYMDSVPPASRFLSTLSLRRATRGACRARPQSRPHFYPRSPCGERPCRKRRQWFHHGNFYPRSPCGERHQGQKVQDQEGHISIHALLAESDCARGPLRAKGPKFLSTLSLRRATYWATRARAAQPFLSTLSLRRATGAVLSMTLL